MTYISYATINSLEETSLIAGSDFTLEFNAFEDDGVTPLDLGGATTKLVLSPYGQTDYTILQLNGIITATSKFEVVLSSSDTEDLSGKYIQQPIITSFGGKEYRPAQGVILFIPRIPIV